MGFSSFLCDFRPRGSPDLTGAAFCAILRNNSYEQEAVIAMADVKKGEGLVYKNHPLRRVDNLIYYGSMADK